MKEERRRSSVVERTLGKGEAVSPILTDGTDEPYPNAPAKKAKNLLFQNACE